jgi:hypothetical protein
MAYMIEHGATDIWVLWETLVVIGLLLQLACYLIALLFLLAWSPIAAGIELYRYLKRQRGASEVGFDDIVLWVEHHLDFLRRFSDFHHGVPCARWLLDLMNRIDPVLFARCFEAFVASMWPGRHDFIAIDGKTARRTHDKRRGFKALHTLSASHPGPAQRAGKNQ